MSLFVGRAMLSQLPAVVLGWLMFTGGELFAQPAKEDSTRLPIPESGSIETAEKLVRETFKADYAKKRPAEQLAFARKLVKAADEMMDNPAGKFVLYREAINAAVRIGEIQVALEASVGMSQAFAVKHGEMELGILESVESAKSASGRVVAEASLELADAAMRANEYEAALKALKVGARGASRVGAASLVNAVSSQTRDAEAMQKAFQSLEADRKTLAANPEDDAANLSVGRFICLRKGDWAAGLPLLAKAKDGKLGAAAQKELASPVSTDDRTALADRWFDLVPVVEAVEKREVRARAYQWYLAALAGANALTKPQVEKRLAELEKQADLKTARSLGWQVLFCSSDPTIWNTDTNRGRYQFAQSLAKAPVGMRYLRLTDVSKGASIIIELTQDRLDGYSEKDGYAWMGKNLVEAKANHLGISDTAWKENPKGSILVYNVPFVVGYRGWGFGHRWAIDDAQGFGWAGEPIQRTVFEFAAKGGPLTLEESKRLLKKKK